MLTIYQQPVTLPKYPEFDRTDRASKSAALATLAAEICERLHEMEEIKVASGGALVTRLAAARSKSSVAYNVIIQLMHGDPTPLLSYAEQAEIRGISKQTIFLEIHREIDKVAHIFPEVAETVERLRKNALSHEDPTSNNDSIRESTHP